MMAKGLRIAEPPRRPAEVAASEPAAVVGEKFSQVREGDKVQFNKRISSGVAEGFEVLAARTRRKITDLLAEALTLLQERYGKV
jgi:hypothetical protein